MHLRGCLRDKPAARESPDSRPFAWPEVYSLGVCLCSAQHDVMTLMSLEAAPTDTIETARMTLRPITREEAVALLNGETPRGLTFAEGYPSEFSREVIDIFVGARAEEASGFTPWHVIRRNEGDLIGSIGWSSSHSGRAVVGYEIVEPLWGQGYASEALAGLIEYLFSRPEVDLIQADTFEGHVASRRVMEKAGMTLFDTRTETVDGEEAVLVFYEIRRPAVT